MLRFGVLALLITSLFGMSAQCHAASPALVAQATPAADASNAVEAPADASSADAPRTESLLAWLGRTLGTRYVVLFLLLTLNLVALMVMNILAVWRDHVVPPAVVRGIEIRLQERRAADVEELLRGDVSLLGRVLAAGVAQLAGGYEMALASMKEMAQHEAMRMYQRLGYVVLIAQLAPLLGLIGSVDGLVRVFGAFAKDVAPRPADLAGDVGLTLTATIVGLWIAVVAVAFHHVVRNRMNLLISEVGILSENLLKRIAAALGQV